MRIIIFVTVSGKKEAEKIAQALVENKLAACVNMIGNINSVFRWEGKLDSAREVLLVIKSRKEKLAAIKRLVVSLHSYQVPEIIALPVIGGYAPYLRWIDGTIRDRT